MSNLESGHKHLQREGAVDYPLVALDPFSPEFLSDPYVHAERLREAGPVVRLTRYDVWACARYAEVQMILRDPSTYCSGSGVGLTNIKREKHWRTPSLLLENDPPDHTRVRRALMRILSPPNIKKLRQLFEPKAAELMDEVVSARSFDAVTDFAEPFPLRVFPDAVGLIEEGRENLIAYGRMNFDSMGPQNQIYNESMADLEQVSSWITRQCQRDALRPGGLGAQVYEAVDAGEVTDEEAALLVRSFLSAGVDTTVNALASAIYCFSRNPDEWRLLHEDPSLAPIAFEEVLRYESPFQMFFRTAAADTEVAGVPIDEGDKILLLVASANRDPRQWPEPERFDIRRRPVGHLAFGTGTHACVGQMIARLEAEVLLVELARRVKSIEIKGEPKWRLSNTLRGLASLPVEIRAA